MTLSQELESFPNAGRALAESEARYKALVAATTQFVWRRGAHNVVDGATDAWWEAVTGQAPDRANGEYGWGWLEQLHPDDRERARAAWTNAFAGRVLFDTEYRVRTRDGAYRHFAVRGVPIGDDPTAQEWIGTFTDVTAAREAEAERALLLDAERQARAVAERAARHAARMASAASAFNAAFTVREATAVLLAESRAALDADAGLVAMLDTPAGEVEIVDSNGYPPYVQGEWRRFPLDARVPIGLALQQGTTVHFATEAERASRFPGTPATGYEGGLVVPLRVGDHQLGALALSFATPRALAPAEQTLLESLAVQWSYALDRARLFEAERNARAIAERNALERAAHELALQSEIARRTQFVATLEQATDFVGIATLDGRATYVNPAARRLVGLRDDVPSESTRIVDYFASSWQTRVQDEIVPQLLRDGHWRGEVRFRHFETGDEIPVEWNPFVVRDEAGEPIALGCIAHDLRAERAAQAERERLLVEAEAANRAKAEFLAVMSHELRTPLNAIAGYVELIELGIHGPVTAEQQVVLGRVRAAQRTLLRHVNDVLNFARLDAGRVEFDLRPVGVRDLLAAGDALVRPQAMTKGVQFTCDACDETLVVHADPEKAEQVLLNLVANAVKFTPAGGGVVVSAEAEDSAWVTIRVADTGVGIPTAKLPAVFDPFVQIQMPGVARQEGTGLGLAISRDLMRGMNGELTVASEVGKGSTFSMRLRRS